MPQRGAMTGPVPPDSVSPAPGPAGKATGGRVPGGGILQSAWKTAADGRTTFRLMPPLLLWWAWVAFALFNVADLIIQTHDRFAVQVIAAIAVVTGLMYSCALRPRIVSDAGGLIVRNPFRDSHVPWGGVTGVYIGDSVEIQCRRPGPTPEKQAKTVYSWALYSPRRARARAELRTGFGARQHRERHDNRARRRYQVPDSSAFGKASAEARAISSRHASHIMAQELARRCEEARKNGPPEGFLAARWAWLPIAGVLLPVAALIAVILAR